MKYYFVKKNFLVLSLSSALAFPIIAGAQQRSAFGGYAHYNMNMHSADFKSLPGTFDCNENNFSSGTGSGFTIGGLYQLPIAEEFSLSLRASYSSLGATLLAQDPTEFGIDGNNVSGALDYKLTANLASIGIEPLASYKIFSGLALNAGIRGGFLMTKKFEQVEEINEPTGKARFTSNNERSGNFQSGDIQEASAIEAAILFGASYDFPLNQTLSVAPEIIYSLSITPVVSGQSWNANALRAGIALKYSPLPSAPEPKPEPKPVVEPPKAEPKAPAFAANIILRGVDQSGQEFPLNSIQVEEFSRTQMQPLIPYIFFDENSSTVPERYAKISSSESKNFSNENLYSLSTLQTYHQVLNIVGKRLKENPRANIAITGYNSGAGDEKNNTDLSKARAEAVKNYLVNTWGIEQKRISISGKNLPPKPSNMQDPDGVEENRRVELSSNMPEILQSLIINDTLRTASPALIKIRPDIRSEAGLSSWRTSINDGNNILAEVNAADNSAREWNSSDDIMQLLRTQNVNYSFIATDKAGQMRNENISIPVEHRTLSVKHRESSADKGIEEYNLMLFDFDKADLTAEHQRAIDVIRPRIKPNSIVTVKGYTDRFGATDYNQRLSQQRAQNVARALGIPQDRAIGLGESVLLYDNNSPEGRFYSRTITISVETPVEK